MNLSKAELNIISIALAQRTMEIQDAIVLVKARMLDVSALVAQYEAIAKLHVKVIKAWQEK